MRLGGIEVKRRVWVGLGCALAVTVAWWGWTRGELPGVGVAPTDRPAFVRLVGVSSATSDQILRERADLFDPTPLFFPTEWNYGQQPLPEGLRRQPGQVFGSFGPKLPEERAIKSYGGETAQAPDKLADILVQGNEAPFAGIGHVDAPPSALFQRDSLLEIRRFGNDKPIIAQLLNGISPPRSDYAPVEFIVVVTPAGVVGKPVLATGSGWEEVDTFFRDYIVKTFRVGQRLNPGHYRVSVGP